MKDFLIRLISAKSDISSMRVMSLMSVIAAIVLAFHGINRGQPLDSLSILCGVFLGAAFGGKVGQKVVEVKQDHDKP